MRRETVGKTRSLCVFTFRTSPAVRTYLRLKRKCNHYNISRRSFTFSQAKQRWQVWQKQKSVSERMGVKFIFTIFLLEITFLLANSEPAEDKQALLDFVQSVSHSRGINWDENSSVCANWIGVTCNHDKSRVIAVRLPGFGFRGSLPPNTLSRLSALQILILKNNGISGPFPSDFSKLVNLNACLFNPMIFLNLSIINLSDNGFNGSIPSSIANLSRLSALNLSNNTFSGEIPDLPIPSLHVLDLSKNNLTGTVPQSLKRFPSWAFLGNHLSIDNSAPQVSPMVPTNDHPPKKSKKLSEPVMLGIIIGGCALGFVVLAVLLIVCYSNKNDENEIEISAKFQKKGGLAKKAVSGSHDRNGRLVFFEGCNLAFDLEDLLRASAEVLGKGTFGTSYKAALEDATTVVVKRLKEVSVARREFEQQMEVVGNIRHDNIAALRAYYYSKDEKLMVSDYFSQGSVSSMLHAKRGENRTPLGWETRLRIAIGAARGIAHIHSQLGGKLVHGNIKSSNIFLNSHGYGCVSDLELLRFPNIEEEMVEMLQIGLACATRIPDQRPKMADVLRRVEDIRQSEGSTPALTPPVTEIGSSSTAN
ncbi:unnamed protein product [Thlaspi arvense]|uniref:Protein kinase domain-containing protein n=1 Tax=Thlaspi arvense TaxID=13288 RepID=A0AAU9RQT6_THLAR|nr:unnamed protein product [Thlaspi arvense]